MKNVFLLLALVCSTSLFAQNKFDGLWKQDYSDYLLHINLSEEKEYKIYFYNSTAEDGFFENITYNDKEKIKTIALFSDGSSYSCEYTMNENGNIICFFKESKEKLIYKKI